jgi:hypothetical protein
MVDESSIALYVVEWNVVAKNTSKNKQSAAQHKQEDEKNVDIFLD